MSLNTTYFEPKKVYEPLPIPDTPGYVPPAPPTPPSPDPGSTPVIPVPSFSGNVSLTLYNNSSEQRKLDKSISSIFTDTIIIKDSVSVVDPVIILNTSTDLTGVNYMQLGNRYYYAKVEMLPGGGRYRITGHSDVLMTFKDQIRNQIGVINRNQNSYNRFLKDDRVKLNAYEQVRTLEFSSGFSKELHYYLIAIGGQSIVP